MNVARAVLLFAGVCWTRDGAADTSVQLPHCAVKVCEVCCKIHYEIIKMYLKKDNFYDILKSSSLGTY